MTLVTRYAGRADVMGFLLPMPVLYSGQPVKHWAMPATIDVYMFERVYWKSFPGLGRIEYLLSTTGERFMEQ